MSGDLSNAYVIGFFSNSNNLRLDKGKQCGKGYISASKKCTVGTGSLSNETNRNTSQPSSEKGEDNNLTQKVAIGAGAGLAVGLGAALVARSLTKSSSNSRDSNSSKKDVKSKRTPYRNQTYDKIFPKDKEFDDAEYTPLAKPPSSGGQLGKNKLWKTLINEQEFFIKRPSTQDKVYQEIAAAKEVFASDLSKIVGLDKNSVPVKKFFRNGNLYLASPMLKQEEIRKFSNKKELHEAISNIDRNKAADFLLYDYVATLSTRHDGNILFKTDNTPVLIDNGSIRHDVQLPNKKKRDLNSLKIDTDKNIFFKHTFASNPYAEIPIESIKKFTSNRKKIREAVELRYSGLPEKVVSKYIDKMENKLDLLKQMQDKQDTRIIRLIKGK